MQGARMPRQWWVFIVVAVIGLSSSAEVDAQAAFAPAAPSYASIVKTIETVRKGWESNAPEVAAGWNAYFDELKRELEGYAGAKTSNDRLGPLNRIYTLSTGLEGVAWAPAVELKEALRSWLRPRVRLAWAERRLIDALDDGSGATADALNRKDWNLFVEDKFGGALRGYESAKSVQARQDALNTLHTALDSLRATHPWSYAAELQTAADDLFNAPNLDVSADVASLFPVLSAQVVNSGPIVRGGYISQVTAGPYAGFGLLYSDQGIAFTNSQYLTSVTPITDFQNQIASDQKGKRAAKLYNFSANSFDNGLLTVTALLTPFGVQIRPTPGHNVDARICSTPTQGNGLARGIAGLIGFGQSRITNEVYSSAIGKIRKNVDEQGQLEANERGAIAQAEQNAKLSQVLRGDGSAVIRDIMIAGLSLRSRPENALIGGTVRWANGPAQGGADLPQPPRFALPAAGISADVHVSSAANNVVKGYLASPDVADVQNLMFETRKVEPGMAPKDAVKATKNVDFPTYLKAVEASKAKNDPTTQAIRIKRPSRAPDFGVDARGFLVVVAHDLQLDIPVPAQVANSRFGGTTAKVYRLVASTAEFVFELKPVTDPATGAIRLTGNLRDFTPAPGSKVMAINDDESKALPLDPFRSVFVFQGFAQAIRSKPLDVPLENLKLRGFVITSVSDLDPTGWIRIVLTPTGERPLAQAN